MREAEILRAQAEELERRAQGVRNAAGRRQLLHWAQELRDKALELEREEEAATRH